MYVKVFCISLQEHDLNALKRVSIEFKWLLDSKKTVKKLLHQLEKITGQVQELKLKGRLEFGYAIKVRKAFLVSNFYQIDNFRERLLSQVLVTNVHHDSFYQHDRYLVFSVLVRI